MPGSLRCRVRHEGSQARVEVHGALTGGTRQRVLDAIWKQCTAAGRTVVVDLSRLTYFDSPSLLALVGMKRIAEGQMGCRVELAGVEEATMRLTGVDDVPAAG